MKRYALDATAPNSFSATHVNRPESSGNASVITKVQTSSERRKLLIRQKPVNRRLHSFSTPPHNSSSGTFLMSHRFMISFMSSKKEIALGRSLGRYVWCMITLTSVFDQNFCVYDKGVCNATVNGTLIPCIAHCCCFL